MQQFIRFYHLIVATLNALNAVIKLASPSYGAVYG